MPEYSWASGVVEVRELKEIVNLSFGSMCVNNMGSTNPSAGSKKTLAGSSPCRGAKEPERRWDLPESGARRFRRKTHDQGFADPCLALGYGGE